MAENAFKADWPSFALGFNTGKSKGGGAELNIAYGDTPPEDTTKLWVKTAEPNGVLISPEVEQTEVDGYSLIELEEVMPTALTYAGCAAVGSKIYILGGCGKDNKAINAVTVYDTETKEFKAYSGVLGSAIAYVKAVAVGTKIYLIGGGSTSSETSVMIRCFDTETMSITTCATELPEALRRVQVGAIGTDIYILGGLASSSTSYRKDVYKYNTVTDDSIEKVGTLKIGAGMGDCVRVGTTFYIYGNGNSNLIIKFDVETLESTTFGIYLNGNTSTTYSTSTSCGAYFGDNYLYFVNTKYVYRIDTITDTTDVLEVTKPYYSSNSAGVMVNNKLFVFGGTGGEVASSNASAALNRVCVFAPYAYAPAIDKDSLYIKNEGKENTIQVVKAGGFEIKVGVDSVYKGNADGVGEPVEAALYKDGEWVTI